MTAKLRRIVGWSLVGLLLLFVVFNFESVEVNFFFVLSLWIPKAILILLSAGLGAGAALAFRYIQDLRKDKPPDTP